MKTNTRNPKWHLVGLLSVCKQPGRGDNWRLLALGGMELSRGTFAQMVALGEEMNSDDSLIGATPREAKAMYGLA